MELTDEQIEILNQLLQSEEKNLLGVIERGKNSSKTVSLDDPIGRVSRIDAIQQQKMAEEGLRRAEQRSRQIKEALTRIEEGTYGYCATCEEPIHFGRLKICPETIFCVRCQGQSEQS